MSRRPLFAPKPTPLPPSDMSGLLEAARHKRKAPRGPCETQDVDMGDEKPSKRPRAEEPSGTRTAPEDLMPPEAASVDRATLIDEANALNGRTSRCKGCNAIIGPGTILCGVCHLPAQEDLTPPDAKFIQSVATDVPEQLHHAIEPATEAAAKAAAAASPQAGETLQQRNAPPFFLLAIRTRLTSRASDSKL